MTVSESLEKLVSLTSQNMQILQAINDAFFSKSNHITASVGGSQYTIPSYVSLENKIIQLQDSFNALVKGSQSGSAWLNYDGNSREIRLEGYQSTPSPLSLEGASIKTFGSEISNKLKDFLTPVPYLNLDMNSLSSDTTQVSIRKIVPNNDASKTALRSLETGNGPVYDVSYLDAYSTLISNTDLVEGTDYQVYDTTYNLPIRNCSEQGTCVVSQLISDSIEQSSAKEIIEVKIASMSGKSNPLVVGDLDGASERSLKVGDTLTTYDGSAKLSITKLNRSERTLTLEVRSGEYININPHSSDSVSSLSGISDYSILRFFAEPANEDRRLHVPLEEDEIVFIAIAPINSRLGVRAAWGTGILVETHKLVLETNSNKTFKSYYDESVKNIGDTLTELSTVLPPAITRYSADEYELFTTTSPSLSSDTFEVVQINRHLDDSESVQTIKSLYSQKKQLQIELTDVQEKIAQITSDLASVSFDDMTGLKTSYEAQLSNLREQQNTISTSINKISDSIAKNAADADVPIENAKYRVRGYIDIEEYLQNTFNSTDNLKYITKVQTRYRYRNSSNPAANIQTIGENYLFTDYNLYEPPLSRERALVYSNGIYSVDENSSAYNPSANEIKFNQVDIPITQGETVVMQARVIWSFGYPFVTTASEWSDALEIEFPDELRKDVEVTTIIEENNDDIETNRFNTILSDGGYTAHINSKITDQDITYYHNASDIASGQYTSERRVIPLKDMISTILSDISELKADLEGSLSTSLKVEFIYNNTTYTLEPLITNNIALTSYASVSNTTASSEYKDGNGIVRSGGIIKITNSSNNLVRIYPIAPGPRDSHLEDLRRGTRIGKFQASDYFTDGTLTSEEESSGATALDDYIYIANVAANYMNTVSRAKNLPYDFKTTQQGTSVKTASNILATNIAQYHTIVNLTDNVAFEESRAVSSLISYLQSTTASQSLYVHSLKEWCQSLASSDPEDDANLTDHPIPESVKKFAEDGTITKESGESVSAGSTSDDSYYGPLVFIEDLYGSNNQQTSPRARQRGNQIITFRRTNPYNGVLLECSGTDTEETQLGTYNYIVNGASAPSGSAVSLYGSGHTKFVWAYPYVQQEYGMCMETNDTISRYNLRPGESVQFNVGIAYVLDSDNKTGTSELGFDIRTSLYSDPTYYNLSFIANYNKAVTDTNITSRITATDATRYSTVVR